MTKYILVNQIIPNIPTHTFEAQNFAGGFYTKPFPFNPLSLVCCDLGHPASCLRQEERQRLPHIHHSSKEDTQQPGNAADKRVLTLFPSSTSGPSNLDSSLWFHNLTPFSLSSQAIAPSSHSLCQLEQISSIFRVLSQQGCRRDGSVVKRKHCSRRGPEFCSQHASRGAYNCL